MSPRKYWESKDSNPKQLCKSARTSLSNFKQIAMFGGYVGGKLALRLSKASQKHGPPMTLEDILFPRDKKMIAARQHRSELRKAAHEKRKEKQKDAA